MIETIRYSEEVVVATILRGVFRWFVTEKELWFLDYRRWKDAFICAGYGEALSRVEVEAERFGIVVLDERSAETFLDHIEQCKADVESLRRLLKSGLPASNVDQVVHLLPSLYVDFDKCVLFSFFYEPSSFEDFVPSGWHGEYRDFWPLIPADQRYWIDGDVDVIATLECD